MGVCIIKDLAESPTLKAEQEMNRSFVLRAVKDVAIEDRVAPKLKDPWDVIVQVAQTGICGSDVSLLL